jgi:hypothetical protein
VPPSSAFDDEQLAMHVGLEQHGAARPGGEHTVGAAAPQDELPAQLATISGSSVQAFGNALCYLHRKDHPVRMLA